MLLKNYLLIAYRSMRKHKAFSLINILGLSIGLASVLGITMFVLEEWKVDRFHDKKERIFRVLSEEESEGKVIFHTGIPGGFSEAIENDFSEVEMATRVINMPYISTWMIYEEQSFEKQFCVADANILEIFDFPLLEGNRENALEKPDAILITESTAKQFFGNENPIGKVLKAEGFWAGEYLVTGVLKDIPKHSSIQFDILSSNVKPMFETWEISDWRPIETFVLVKEGADRKHLEEAIGGWKSKYQKEEGVKISYHLQALDRIHLYSSEDYALQSKGDITTIRLLILIGGFILLIALFNFMNLATARAMERAKEVGVRKVSGAGRGQLIVQFLGESILITLISMVIAINLLHLLIPFLNDFTGKEMKFLSGGKGRAYLVFVLGTLVVGSFAGAYPAFVLSSFKPANVLKGDSNKQMKGLQLRRLLVITQFVITSVLLIGTIIIYQQWQYLNEKKWGFNKDEVLVLPIFANDPEQMFTEKWLGFQQQAVKDQFLRHPNVLSASVSHVMPPISIPTTIKVEGGEEAYPIQYIYADKDFLKTYQIELLKGRNFSKELLSEARLPDILINETAARQLGWKDPIGKQVVWEGTGETMNVIGIIKDFLNQDLSQTIQPLFLTQMSQPPQLLSLRLKMENLEETLAFLEETWQTFLPTRPFNYEFADENVKKLYGDQVKTGKLIGASSALAFFIACMGLFGLAAFTTQRRVREIGIRKVLGASFIDIISMLSKDFMKLILVALIIAIPIAYYFMNDWLNNFAFRIKIEWWVFIFSAFLTLFIAFSTISFQSVKAALVNPVESLKGE